MLFTTAATGAKQQGFCRGKMSHCAMQKQHQAKGAQHQPCKTEQGRLNMQIKTKMLILPSEREKGRRVCSRHVAAYCLLRTERNFFNRKTIDFSVKMVKIFFAGLPPRTPV